MAFVQGGMASTTVSAREKESSYTSLSNHLEAPQAFYTPSNTNTPSTNHYFASTQPSLTRTPSLKGLQRSVSGSQSQFYGMEQHGFTPKSVRWEDKHQKFVHPQASEARAPQGYSLSGSYNISPNNSHQLSNKGLSDPSSGMGFPQRRGPESTSFDSVSLLQKGSFGQSEKQQGDSSKPTIPPSSRSVFSNTLPSNAHTSSPTLNSTTPQTGRSSSLSLPKSGSHPSSHVQELTVVPRHAIVSRIKWNLAALLLNWLIPRLEISGSIYWFILASVYRISNGKADLQLAGLLSWFRTALSILTIINVVEAAIRLQTYQDSALRPSDARNSSDRRPSLAHPPSRASSASYSTSTPLHSSSSQSTNKRSTPKHYAPDSPLRESIFRANLSAQREQRQSPSLGSEWRMPSQTPRFEARNSGSVKLNNNGSPLAAYLARKHERVASGQSFGDLSFEGEAGEKSYDPKENKLKLHYSDLSSDSIEVDRALRALSASYERQQSQSRESASPVNATL